MNKSIGNLVVEKGFKFVADYPGAPTDIREAEWFDDPSSYYSVLEGPGAYGEIIDRKGDTLSVILK